jgi:prepilin-type processing-associated H-X9-DG protein
LVVVTIISMLAALLLPAVMGARSRARIAQCMNNQRELGLAIHQYEMAKQHLPGYLNRQGVQTATQTSCAVTWIPVLLPFLGRMDLWEGNPSAGSPGWRQPVVNMAIPQLKQIVCPDDTPASTGGLSYVVNVGISAFNVGVPPYFPPLDPLVAGSPPTPSEYGVFRDLLTNLTPSTGSPSAPRQVTLSSIKSPSTRPLLSECTYAFDTASASSTVALRQWNLEVFYDPTTPPSVSVMNLTTAANAPGVSQSLSQRYGFVWPDATTAAANNIAVMAPFLPALTLPQTTIHPGIVIITFCDGHVESVADNALCSVYDCSPIP